MKSFWCPLLLFPLLIQSSLCLEDFHHKHQGLNENGASSCWLTCLYGVLGQYSQTSQSPKNDLDSININFHLEIICHYANDLMLRDLEKDHEHKHEVHCSRERSRVAWNIIDKYLMPFIERERYAIPKSCRLHPDSDIFRDQEEHKIKVDVNEWQCGYCNKGFLSEEFIDQHLDSRHSNLLNFTGGKCLADLCGALHCDHVLKSKPSRSKCNQAAAARNHHLCESLADACFPVSQGPSANRLHELFLHQFCDAHTCSSGRKPFPKGGRKERSLLYMAASILTLMLLPLFYVVVFLHQSEMQKDSQELKRISRFRRKTKAL